MSFLSYPRLIFSGLFQADPSTVNNDPRHYSNEYFEERFQEFTRSGANGTQYNGWWNPPGTSIFRFAQTKVNSLWGDDGQALTDPTTDPAFALTVGNTLDQSSAKIVDLDPDWQLASELYGLVVSLTAQDGRTVFTGRFEVAPFRDLWFSRGPGGGDGAATASFQSVLTDLQWNIDGFGSAFLERLKAEADKAEALSVRLTTFAYDDSVGEATFTYGSLLGAIGPYAASEPRSFVLGRRFTPTPQQGVRTLNGAKLNLTWFSGAVVDVPGTGGAALSLDLSNTLPVDADAEFIDYGPLPVAALKHDGVQAGDVVAADDCVVLGEITDYKTLQHVLGGILDLPLTAEQRDAIADRPLAILVPNAPRTGPGAYTVASRETPDGLQLRPEKFTFRLHSDDNGPRSGETVFYAARYGAPLAGRGITFDLAAQALDTDDAPTDAPPVTTPAAPVPFNNAPLRMIAVTPAEPVTDADGKAAVTLTVTGPLGYPRGYFDGQLYVLDYNLAHAARATANKSPFDRLAALVFSAYDVPEKPVWADIQPIMQQYSNLYPVMSRQLFDFANEDQARSNAYTLKFAFTRPFEEAGHMPVTRDLSNGKRKAILAVLDSFIAEAGGAPPPNAERFANRRGRCPMGHA